MNSNNAGENHAHKNAETLQALSCLFLLEVEHGVTPGTKIFIDNLRHQLANLEQLIAIEPIC